MIRTTCTRDDSIGGTMVHEKTYTTLEYDKILTILKQHLASEVGQEFAQKLRPACKTSGGKCR